MDGKIPHFRRVVKVRCGTEKLATGHLYGRANFLVFLAQDAVCAVGLDNKLRHPESARLAKSVR